MILSDGDIRERLKEGDLVVDPIDDPELQIQPASVDLRLDRTFVVYQVTHVPYVDPFEQETLDRYTEEVNIKDGDGFILHPNEFALGSTKERVEIPADLVGRVEGRSSIGRLAVVVHATAGFVDPGFQGHITLELSNLGNVPVKLYPDMRISQIVFHETKSPAELPYGQERGSKYQSQNKPTPSRLGIDEERDSTASAPLDNFGSEE